MLRSYIHNYLITYRGRIQRVLDWQGRINLFEPGGEFTIAKWLLDEKEPAENCLERLGFSGELSDNGFLKQCIAIQIHNLVEDLRLQGPRVLTCLEYEDSQLRFPELVKEAASSFLTRNDITNESMELLRSFFLRHLGDPRLPAGRIRWSEVSEKARKVFAQWLSKQDLEFFFRLVDKTAHDPNWRFRRKFWEAYLEHFDNSYVILSHRAKRLIDTERAEKYSEERGFGLLRGAMSDQSAFFISMGGYDFIEWSHSGACRIWRKERSPLNFEKKYFSVDELRKDTFDHRLIHSSPQSYNWQKNLASWIQRNCRITTTKSYNVLSSRRVRW